MKLSLLLPLGSFFLLLPACRHVSNDSKPRSIIDVVDAQENSDGTYTITCRSGQKETVTYDQYANDQVCRFNGCMTANNQKVDVGQYDPEPGGLIRYNIATPLPPDNCEAHAHKQQRKCIGSSSFEVYTDFPGYTLPTCMTPSGCNFKLMHFRIAFGSITYRYDSENYTLAAGETINFPATEGASTIICGTTATPNPEPASGTAVFNDLKKGAVGITALESAAVTCKGFETLSLEIIPGKVFEMCPNGSCAMRKLEISGVNTACELTNALPE